MCIQELLVLDRAFPHTISQNDLQLFVCENLLTRAPAHVILLTMNTEDGIDSCLQTR